MARYALFAYRRLSARLTEAVAVVRFVEVVEGVADGDDAGRVDRRLAVVIVPLDLIELAGPTDGGHLIEVAHKAPDVRIILNTSNIALEVRVVDVGEADGGREHRDVRFGQLVSAQVALFAQYFLCLIERGEDIGDRFLIRSLLCRKARAVDAVVVGLVDVVEHRLDLLV